ncbi:hypothetical protein Q3G72_023420 [Acer saccharum]|nr:hypothetical protein Q3G72_023420 [Acer saccharum]
MLRYLWESEIPKSIALPSCPSYPDTSQPDRSSSQSSRLVAAALSCRHRSPCLTVLSSVSGCRLQDTEPILSHKHHNITIQFQLKHSRSRI